LPVNEKRLGNRGRPDSSILVTGVVSDYDTTDDTYSVETNGEVIDGCRNMVGPAASFLGLRVSSRIPTGSFVVLLPQDPPLILNTGAIEFADKDHCHDKQMTGTGIKNLFQDTAGVEPGMPQGHTPNDLAEGEFEWSRANGPLFRFLTGLVALGADDLSKIEFNLHRELVRLTSYRTFQHFSACGDTNEYDDGTLNQEEHGTSYVHERLGLEKEDDEIMSVDEAPDLDEWMEKTGRWRWSKYRGFLGDLVNHWCTDPQQAAGEMLNSAGQYRAGKWREYIGHDGSFLMESCGEIALEKVTRIPVPIRLKHEEDPDGVTRRMVKELDASFLKQWKWDKENPHYTAFMLRDYARYLSRFQSLARFHQMAAKGEFYVPKESQTPQPLDPRIKPDREPIVWIDVYATIRIMHDGSIVTVDGYGNTTFSGPPGIIYSSVADIQFYAARDIVHKAGRSVFINGRRHVEIAANRGSILLKARTGLRALVERGVLWLKSDYDPENLYTPEEEGDPEIDEHGDVGLIIQCEKAGMLSRSLENSIAVTGNTDTPGELKIKAEKFRLNAAEAVVTVDKNLDIKGQKIRLAVRQIVSDAVNLLWFKGMLKMANGRMELRSLISDSLRVNSTIAATSSTVGEVDAVTILEDPSSPDNTLPEFEPPPAEVFPSRPWAMFTQEEYKPLEYLYEPLTQQRARLGEDLRRGDAPDFKEWDGMTDALLSSSWTSTGGAPWPGKSAQWLSYQPEYDDELGKPAEASCDSFRPVDSKPSLAPISYRFVP
jgi:hypothetical protein